MNWLAHLYLSEDHPAVRLGSVLPDILPVSSLASLPADYQRGITQHRHIDLFTDSHPVVRQSIRRFAPPFRRFGGILTDLFYDHFLARDWCSYSSEPLPEFALRVYASFDQLQGLIPAYIHARLNQMRATDWLSSYQSLPGIARAVERIGSRLRRPVDLAPSISVLQDHYELFQSDFQTFFPELRAHVAQPSGDK